MNIQNCSGYGNEVYHLFRQEERLQRLINHTVAVNREIKFVNMFRCYDHRISSLIYKQIRCDDKLFRGIK